MELVRNTDGFTLIEILIATAIVTIISLGMANLTAGIIHGNSFSKQLTTATTLAQDRLEQIKRVGYANADTITGTETYGNIVNYSSYKRVTSVSNNTPSPNMKAINVVVYWNADKHLVSLGTILTE
jgi:type IV pilus assembly protein PilV